MSTGECVRANTAAKGESGETSSAGRVSADLDPASSRRARQLARDQKRDQKRETRAERSARNRAEHALLNRSNRGRYSRTRNR